jgi:hypothetical protein
VVKIRLPQVVEGHILLLTQNLLTLLQVGNDVRPWQWTGSKQILLDITDTAEANAGAHGFTRSEVHKELKLTIGLCLAQSYCSRKPQHNANNANHAQNMECHPEHEA